MRVHAAILLLGLGACAAGDDPDGMPETAVVRIVTPGSTHRIPVEIVATPASRQQGLMNRPYLPPDRGMLFVYPEAAPRGFWMKNCLVPIDAAFLASDGYVFNIAEMLPEPGSEFPRTYPSAAPVRIVLEMPGGWFRDHGVAAGDRVVIPEEILRLEAE